MSGSVCHSGSAWCVNHSSLCISQAFTEPFQLPLRPQNIHGPFVNLGTSCHCFHSQEQSSEMQLIVSLKSALFMLQGTSGWLRCGDDMMMMVVVRGGPPETGSRDIFQLLALFSSPSHHAEQGRQSQARLLVVGACPPSHAPPTRSSPQQL